MPSYNEFQDLEEALRRKKPKTDPFPLSVQCRLRIQLLEEATMNQSQLRLNITRLATILGGLAVIIVIPLLFWVSLRNQANLETFAPLEAEPQEDETPEEDSAEIVQIGLAKPAVNNTIEAPITVAYSLVSAEEATLYLTYTFTDEEGTFYGERLQPVVQGRDEVVFIVDMPATAVHSNNSLKDEIQFAVELIIGAELLTGASTHDPHNYATLTTVGTALPNFNDPTVMNIPVQISYKLTDYAEASVVVGYKDDQEASQTGLQGVPELVDVVVDKEGNRLSTKSYMLDEAGNPISVQEINDNSALSITMPRRDITEINNQTAPQTVEVTVDNEGNVLGIASYLFDESGTTILRQGSGQMTSHRITKGEGTLSTIVAVPNELVNEDGVLHDNVGIWVFLKLIELTE